MDSTLISDNHHLFAYCITDGILDAIIASENLKADETARFVENAFRDGAIRTTGTDIDKILPVISRFGGGN